MFLNRISSRFIERIDFFEIMSDLFLAERMKRDVGADGKKFFLMRPLLHQTHPGDDLVRFSLKLREHLLRIIQVFRFAKNFSFQKNQRVGADDECVGMFFSNRTRFAMSIQLAKFIWRKLLVENFLRAIGNDLKVQTDLAQQLRASRRFRSQDERWHIHEANLFRNRKLSNVELKLETSHFKPENHAMQKGRHIVNIALIGFMGTGKTSVGRLVAEQLRFDYLDTDEMIQSATGRTIADIFSRDGEAAFRTLEEKVVEEISTRAKTVISTGGGLPVNPKNLSHLKSHALVVCLWASPERIWERVKSQTHRPLLDDADPQKKIRDLLAMREPFYKKADVLLNTEVRSLREVAQQVVHQFRLESARR